MVSNIVLIGDVSDVDIIPQNLFEDKNSKIFSFDIDTHQKLESKKIFHEMAENFLNQKERMEIFDKIIKFSSWHSKLHSTNYEFENVNLLKLLDSNEFNTLFLPKLINFVLIKRIIEKEKPSKIFSTTLFSTTIKSIINEKKIESVFFHNSITKKFLWDTIPIKYNFGKLNFEFNLSRKKYLKIKNFMETTLNYFFRLKFDLNSDKKSIVFIEFNPQSFSNLFDELKHFDGNIILVNQRRPAIWSKNSLGVVRNSNCKILQLEEILNEQELNEISQSYEKLSVKINELWNNSDFFNNYFQFEDISFWNVMKEHLIQVYSERLFYYMKLITSVKKFFNCVDISCIVSLNEIGETEKTFLEFNKNRFPSILLEHGFNDKNDSVSFMKRFDVLSNYDTFKDKIAVWSETKKKYLIDNYGLDPNRIIVSGSPRHDNYFSSRMKKENNKEKILLLAPNPISEMGGLSTTELKLKFNEFLTKTISIIKKFDDVKLIVKLHPFPLKHNEEIKSLIKEIDENIPIYLSNSVIDVVNSADIVMVISPEPGTTTMILESMILGKPTMNIYFEKEIPKYNHVKNNAVLSLLNDCNLEDNLQKILFDEKFQKELLRNAEGFISKYLNYTSNSSKTLAKILKSYK